LVLFPIFLAIGIRQFFRFATQPITSVKLRFNGWPVSPIIKNWVRNRETTTLKNNRSGFKLVSGKAD